MKSDKHGKIREKKHFLPQPFQKMKTFLLYRKELDKF